MADLRIDVSSALTGLQEVDEAIVRPRLRAGINESLAFLQTEVQRETPVYRNILRGGTFTEIRGTAMDMQGIVSSPPAAREYAADVEEGQRPGRWPDRADITLWCQRKLGDASAWWVVSRKIFRVGTTGAFMFKKAYGRGRNIVPAIMRRHFEGL